MSSFIVPGVFIGYGLVSLAGDNALRKLDYSTSSELQEDHPVFAMKIDNYSRYAPALAVYGLDLVGMKAKNGILDRSVLLIMSYAIASGSTSTLKGITNRWRPSGVNDHAFPSTHTALAFMTAEFLHQEYKDQSVWYGVAGYAVATGTGILRLYNNAHWVSDVVAGAGFGILSTRLAYLIYPYFKRSLFKDESEQILFSLSYQNGTTGFTLVKQF